MKNFFTDFEKFSKSIAFTTIDEQISYKKLIEELNDFSKKIEARKLAFIISENCIESIVGYLACLKSGVVPLMIGKSIDKDLFLELIKIYKPNYLWAKNDFEVIGSWDVIHKNRKYNLYNDVNNYSHNLNKDLALLIMTSGSTGSPALVRLSYGNIYHNSISITKSLDISKEDKPITTLPMNYTYGLSIINSHLLNGCEIVLTEESILSKGFWSLLEDKKATTFGGVPYTYQMLKRLGFEKMNLSNITKLTQAGGKLDEKMVKFFAEISISKKIKFFVMYGQTEATARMSCLPYNKVFEKAGSIGLAIPNGSFYLIDNDSCVIEEPDIIGELMYKGPNVSMGYAYNINDLNLGDLNQGILATGDLAKKDIDGYYYIVGRKKRFIKIFGNRISLDDVENILLKSGFNCVCSGIDDKLYLFTDSEKDVLDLKLFISNKINIHHSAISVKFISSIPRNDSGKILYSQLQIN